MPKPVHFGPALSQLFEAGWRIIPTSCNCGGHWAWIHKDVMRGCICCSTPLAYPTPCRLRGKPVDRLRIHDREEIYLNDKP